MLNLECAWCRNYCIDICDTEEYAQQLNCLKVFSTENSRMMTVLRNLKSYQRRVSFDLRKANTFRTTYGNDKRASDKFKTIMKDVAQIDQLIIHEIQVLKIGWEALQLI